MPTYDETTPLLDRKIYDEFLFNLKAKLSGRNAFLVIYLLLVVITGTANRVTFKIMQYATINYSYFDSQITTFIFVPINFAVIFFKIMFTTHITPEMRKFPKYKFAVMGLLDSLQGLLIVVGGVHVPGIMQSLLLQGAVPVTMLFSIAMLRERGCSKCRKARDFLREKEIPFTETTTLPVKCKSPAECVCKVTVNGMNVDTENMENLLDSMKLTNRHVVLYTSSRPWGEHLKSFYSPAQYIGAIIVLGGLFVSVLPAFLASAKTAGAGPPLFDLIFFLATIPTAASGVYKEIAFREVEDMDVWFLNGWVCLFQFLFGLSYAPLAAKMSDLPIKQIPSNLYQGLECWLLGRNTITSDCSSFSPCGTAGLKICCDSCDGSLPYISSVPALWAVIMYMGANIMYNIFLVLVIKYGSAALMYIASTLVLPLGSISFTIRAFLGHNTQKFTPYSGAGLGVVLLGLITYRFLGKKKGATDQDPTRIITAGGMHEPLLIERPAYTVPIRPRTQAQVRNSFYSKLGLAVPLSHLERGGINNSA